MLEKVTITGYRTRKEIAEILDISQRSLYTLLTSEYFKDKIPKRGRLSPEHQRMIFDYCGILYN
ncbi:MAG: hypothetical protein SFU99_02000 [Saprospiraceae bacterium]|nr:hypothetical protein [Saprospiraceae bacterium]